MKTKLIFASVVYIILVVMALSKPNLSIVSDSLIVGSTLFYALFSVSIIINNKNSTKNN
jgi:hypothetical protein